MKTIILFVTLIASASATAQTNYVDSLKQAFALHPNDTVGINTLNILASHYARTDIKQSHQYLHLSIRLAKRLQTKKGLSSTYSQLTTSHQALGNNDSATYYLGKLEYLSREFPLTKVLYNYYTTAGLYNKNNGKFKEALVFMLKALDLNGPEETLNRAGLLLNIGNNYGNMGEVKMATKYHLQALKLFETLGNERGQSFCLQSLGNDFVDLQEYATAKSYLLQSEVLKEKLNDARGLAVAWIVLGQVEIELNNLKESRVYLDKAFDQCTKLKLKSEQIKVHYNLAILEKKLGNIDKAKIHFEESLATAKEAGDNPTIVVTIETELAELNDTRLTQNRQDILKTKIATALKSGDRTSQADGHYNLSQYYASKRQYNKAFEHLDKYVQVNDSIRGSTVTLQVKNLEKQYETEKKENEIALLKKDQSLKAAVIAKQKSNQVLGIILFTSFIAISALLINRYRIVNRTARQLEIEKMRNNIARDLHDDIGSTLSSINIISQLALSGKGNTNFHLQKIADNSSQMMENMADIVWSIHSQNNSFANVLVKMKEFAAEILEPKGITYKFIGDDKLSEINIDIERRKNLFLIFKEAINNVAKYSNATEVTIKLDKVKDSLHFSVLDNGEGFDLDTVKAGNGLKNMENRALSVKGVLKKESKIKAGTAIKLEMPIT